MTIMFSDMRGFTSISETYKSDPQGLTALMNRFLTPLTNAILARKGTIDKYMGDAIMAFWNAPLDDKEHQLNACEAALDMLERVDRTQQEREQEAQERAATFIPLNVGVGLNTGTCVVGNMGSDLRFDYSVLGDSVNLASRLEGQSKEYGLQPDRRQVLEPVLRLHELLHLRRQRMRVGVVHHPHQHGVVDDQRMRLRQQFVLLGGSKVCLASSISASTFGFL
jgi:class 3 adenylate cyclase